MGGGSKISSSSLHLGFKIRFYPGDRCVIFMRVLPFQDLLVEGSVIISRHSES